MYARFTCRAELSLALKRHPLLMLPFPILLPLHGLPQEHLLLKSHLYLSSLWGLLLEDQTCTMTMGSASLGVLVLKASTRKCCHGSLQSSWASSWLPPRLLMVLN